MTSLGQFGFKEVGVESTHIFLSQGSLTNWQRAKASEHQPKEGKVQVGHRVPVKTKSTAAETEHGLGAARGWGRGRRKDHVLGTGFPLRAVTRQQRWLH